MNKKIIVLILVIIGILVFVGLIVGANITKTNEQQEELNATLTKMEENNQYDASAKEVYEQAKEIGGIEVANATIESWDFYNQFNIATWDKFQSNVLNDTSGQYKAVFVTQPNCIWCNAFKDEVLVAAYPNMLNKDNFYVLNSTFYRQAFDGSIPNLEGTPFLAIYKDGEQVNYFTPESSKGGRLTPEQAIENFKSQLSPYGFF